MYLFNTFGPKQNVYHLADFFLEWKCLNFDNKFTHVFPKGPIDIKTALFQMMAWRLTGAKPLSETMMA